jgi:hypothetical protein
MNDITQYDQVEHFWCPMLGQTIKFGYCRKMQAGLPCHRVLTCFQSHFPVEEFLDEHYSREQCQEFLAQPQSRLGRVMDTLDQVTKGKREE